MNIIQSASKKLLLALMLSYPLTMTFANQEFVNHGVAAPVAQTGWGSTQSTVDSKGKRIILFKLWTGGGGGDRRLMRVDVDTGESTILTPQDGANGSGGYATFLSSKNRYYDMVDKPGYTAFYEYDVESGVYLSEQKLNIPGSHGSAFSMTETDDGIIYLGSLSDAGGRLLSYNPDTKEITDHGAILDETTWLVYPNIISDDQGWVYIGTMHFESRIVAWHPEHGKRDLLPEDKRKPVSSGVNRFRSDNGKAYIAFDSRDWYELYNGEIQSIERPPSKSVLFRYGWRDSLDFGDGSKALDIDVPNRISKIQEADGTVRDLLFDYDSSGCLVYSLCPGNDGKLYGSTGIPLRFFRYDPQTGKIENWGLGKHAGHINDMVAIDHFIWGAVYSNGELIRYDTREEWDNQAIWHSKNPVIQHNGSRHVYGRPSVVHKHRDGKHILVAGNPARGLSGGGMLIYNIESGEHQVIEHEALAPKQGIKSLVSLEENLLLLGSTTEAATGAVKVEGSPQLLVYDWENRQVRERIVLDKEFNQVRDMFSPDGKKVYGLVSGPKSSGLFVVNPSQSLDMTFNDLSGYGLPAGVQAPRIFSKGPDGNVYLVYQKHILRIDAQTDEVELAATIPVSVLANGGWIDNRLYFSSGPEIWSWQLGDSE